MPRHRGDPPRHSEPIHLRIREDIMKRCHEAKLTGLHSDMSDAGFMSYLVGIGINVYEQQIMPVETGSAPKILREPTQDESSIGPSDAVGQPEEKTG